MNQRCAATRAPSLTNGASLSIYALHAEVAVRITRVAHMHPRHVGDAPRPPRGGARARPRGA
ncbi:hypothetical protein [Burkholderia pseudomallei]|uniref:hypothetical protein n=1 Tax=Burkholderia pseudomallei TaxID=28450 RepID=UPI000F58C8B2|nr:hypothetical protein EGT86_16830 [Burkholderia pseudomallei]